MRKYLSHVLSATQYSWQGLVSAYKHEIAFRSEVCIFVIIVPICFMLEINFLERSLLIASWLWVMIVELINSAIENIVDRISPEPHHLSGRAKDLGSAAVFMSIILAILIWIGILA